MIQLSILFDRHVVHLTYIDIKKDKVNLKCLQSERFDDSLVARQSSKQAVVCSSLAVGRIFFSSCDSRFLRVARKSNQPIQMK